jgi:hypothetical protein
MVMPTLFIVTGYNHHEFVPSSAYYFGLALICFGFMGLAFAAIMQDVSETKLPNEELSGATAKYGHMSIESSDSCYETSLCPSHRNILGSDDEIQELLDRGCKREA